MTAVYSFTTSRTGRWRRNEAIWECSGHTYGAPRLHAWLRREGYRTSRERVARIIRTHGWVGVSGRRRPRTTIVDKTARAAEDPMARNFNPAAPDVVRSSAVSWAGHGRRLHSSGVYMTPNEKEATGHADRLTA